MRIKVILGDITEQDVDAIIVNLFEEVKVPGGSTGVIDKALGGLITNLIGDGEIRGKESEITLIHTNGKIKPVRVVVVGVLHFLFIYFISLLNVSIANFLERDSLLTASKGIFKYFKATS